MRIVSLLPSATEIVCAVGLTDSLVAVTHECDYPPGVAGKPVLTSSALSGVTSSGAIDRHIRRLVHEGSSVYDLDADRLANLRPDLILTQELCAVCAVSYPIVRQAARRLEGPVQLVSLEPQSLDDLLENIRLVGELTGCDAVAAGIISGLRARLAALQARVADQPRRSVLCLEWTDPPFNSGHWTPELVSLAGGRDVLGATGRPASALSWEQIATADAGVVVVMACGLSVERALIEVQAIRSRLGRRELWVVDANAYFSRPGPRLVDSAEIMAGILHPERMPPPDRRQAVPVA
ncbi:MAG: cobalamin-binding protein [Candidatus Dormibacteraeota bacterium]|nr:cobalamin-binding protein [Candidatus Dormibacteraeota bacterium]